MAKQTVAIIGRPNVGKSTLFNKLAGKKIAIIEDIPGITRDRIYEEVTYHDYTFNLIDTGGIDIDQTEANEDIKNQALIAIEEADVICFMVDGKEEVTANDKIVASLLRKSNKPVILVVNKIDNIERESNVYNFYELGFEQCLGISAEHNSNITDLLDLITSHLQKEVKEEYQDMIKFCVIGRPNVGKSSLVNAILNEERVLVSDKAGTTRDAIDTVFKYEKENYVVIDTAGMRKKGRIVETTEKYSLIRAMKAIDRSDICLLILDLTTGIIEHDKHIAGYALEAGKGIIIVANKWDTVDNKEESLKELDKLIKHEFDFISYAPIVYLSALTKKRLHTLMPEIIKVNENINKEIKTNLLNDLISEAYAIHPAPSYKGRRLKINYVHQVKTKPPTFIFHVNDKGLVHFSYQRYLQNFLRDNIDFTGTPIRIFFKNKS